MIRFGQREFPVPMWLWASLPLAAVLYVAFDLNVSATGKLLAFSNSDVRYLEILKHCAVGSIMAFLMADVVRRATVPWYSLPLLLFISMAVAAVITDQLNVWSMEIGRLVLGLAFAAAAGRGGAGGVGLALFGGQALAALLIAAAVAVLVALSARLAGGLPLASRDTWRDVRINFGGAVIWLALAIAGYIAIRFSYGLQMGRRDVVPSWLPMLAAIAAALIATLLHLAMARRSRREVTPAGNPRLWLLILLCVAAYLYRPYLLGGSGWRFYLDHVRPIILVFDFRPKPALAVAGYVVNVPYDELTTNIGPKPPAETSYVSVPLPKEYGVTGIGRHPPRVALYRRNALPNEVSSFWPNRRRMLDDAQAKEPGAEIVLHPDDRFGGVILRSGAFPEIDFQLAGFAPETTKENAEAALRRFIKQRVAKR